MNWIEINEDRSNLPNLFENILITNDQSTILIGCRSSSDEGEIWFFEADEDAHYQNEIIAWMPLPEPFKKQ
jgi:hypothetical protein